MLKAHLLIIDPQNDFMDIRAAEGDAIDGAGDGGGLVARSARKFRSALPVPGAMNDMERCAKLVQSIGHRLNGIHVTLDSHRIVDVAHSGFWRDKDGNSPTPFTLISHDDVNNDTWMPRSMQYRQRMLHYTAALQKTGKFTLMIWPEHCLIGSWGHNVVDVLKSALDTWERDLFVNVNYVAKGINPFTEHYGALMAEVPDPSDPSTQLNSEFISILRDADIIGIAGEASSHCVKTTIEQIVDNIGVAYLPKIHILTDCMSPIPHGPGAPDFPAIAESFLRDMQARGLVLSTHDAFLT